MEVKMIKKRSRPLASGATQTFPEGWTGNVQDDLARSWISEGAAVPLAASPAAGQQFTETQAAVLQAAADQMLAIASQQPITLDDLTDDELRALAKDKKINGYNLMKREKLIGKLGELLQAPPAADPGAAAEA